MVESITAEIYNSVDNVLSVAGYENDQEETDAEGRPPKSVEIIVDGGDDGEIASTIYRKKANGVRAYGNVVMDVSDVFGNIHRIGFSRPDYLYIWLKVSITGKTGKVMAPNYAQLTQDSILEDGGNLQVGDSVYLQTYLAGIYNKVVSVSMVDIRAFAAETEKYVPGEDEFARDNIMVNHRQKALLDAARIEVVLNNG